MLTIYLSALMATLAAQMAPGPNLLAVANVALAQGRFPALCVAAGVASGVLVWVAAFAFGVSALFDAYPPAGAWLQLLGGGYLLFIAAKALMSAFSNSPSMLSSLNRPLPLVKAYRRGLLVVMTNPKAAMMWTAITAFLSGSGLSSGEVLLFAPIGALSALLVYGGYGVLFSSAGASRAHQRMARGFEAGFGVIFGALGYKLFYEGIRPFRV